MTLQSNYEVFGEESLELITLEELSKVYQRLAVTGWDEDILYDIIAKLSENVEGCHISGLEDQLKLIDTLSKVMQRVVSSSKNCLIANDARYITFVSDIESKLKHLMKSFG